MATTIVLIAVLLVATGAEPQGGEQHRHTSRHIHADAASEMRVEPPLPPFGARINESTKISAATGNSRNKIREAFDELFGRHEIGHESVSTFPD